MTDRIMARFMGVMPPGFLTLTASLYLPLAENGAVTPEDESRHVRLLRDLAGTPTVISIRQATPRHGN